MRELSVAAGRIAVRSPLAGHVDRIARGLVRRRLNGFSTGRLEIVEHGVAEIFGDRYAPAELCASIRVLDSAFWSEVAFGGAIGAGEAFMLGLWNSEDLTRVVRVMLRNREVLEHMESGAARVMRPFRRVLHWLNRNTRVGSRRNIAAHYDLGNEFFTLWLDSRMMYSSALFERPGMTLEDASAAKLERICRKLQLAPGDRVLEIGTGWGGFAIYAATKYGCHVTTTTISRQQYEYARRRVRELGLEDRVSLLFEDYRDLPQEWRGRFDKLVSIEMIEAVGHRFQPLFFRTCCELLKDDGLMLLQSITIAERHYDRARRSVDFIQRHIFPGGCLTSVAAMMSMLARETDLRTSHVEDFGPSYAATLQCWHERYSGRVDEVRMLGYPEEFVRMWHYYLSYCEGAFLERAIGVVQMLLARPLNRRDACLE